MSAAPQSNPNGRSPALPDPGALSDPVAVGQIMARSGLFPDITRVSQAVVKVMAGRELGIGPFASMSDIHVIDGQPVLGARILAALVRQSPVYDYEVIEWSNERCELAFTRHGQRLEPTVAFTEADAELAGLNKPTRSAKPSNHMKFPRNMKFARAMSNGVGLHCPDLTAGAPVYTPDELGVEDPEAGVEPVEATVVEEPLDDLSDAAPPVRAAANGGGETAVGPGATPSVPVSALAQAARESGYTDQTIAALCRFYCDTDDPAALDARQARELTDRVRLAAMRGVTDARLAGLAARGAELSDRPAAIAAADAWLTRRGRDEQRPAA